MQLSYDELCQNKQLAFTIFSKVKAPHQLIEAIQLILNWHNKNINKGLQLLLLSTFTFCLILKMRNSIFALTARLQFMEYQKILHCSNLAFTTFQNYNRQLYNDKVNKIQKKYDFTLLTFNKH